MPDWLPSVERVRRAVHSHCRRFALRLSAAPASSRRMRSTFTEIFEKNVWGHPETRSGPGSTVIRTTVVRDGLTALLRELRVQTLLDAPCGDFNWMKEADLPVRRYIGVDVVPAIIESNRRLYALPGREFRNANIVADPLPRAELVFCRDALVHLSFSDALAAIANFRRSGSEFLLTTHFPGTERNHDIDTGAWRPLNLRAAPFRFPQPLRLMTDGCPLPEYADKSLALWRLADLD